MAEKVVLTTAQWRALQRLSKVDPDCYLSARGHLRSACHALAEKGLAEFVAHGKWDNSIYRITEAGRAALEGAHDG